MATVIVHPSQCCYGGRALWLQSTCPVGRVAAVYVEALRRAKELGSLGIMSTTSHLPDVKSGQFARMLHSVESAHDDARVKGVAIPYDKMRPATHPPDAVLRAYSDLLSHVLVFQRGLSVMRDVSMEEAADLADAMHNIAELLVDYGVQLDDEKYRALYLRPFDRRWAQDGFGLEQFLESRLNRYSED